jgi:hypothetical protein
MRVRSIDLYISMTFFVFNYGTVPIVYYFIFILFSYAEEYEYIWLIPE